MRVLLVFCAASFLSLFGTRIAVDAAPRTSYRGALALPTVKRAPVLANGLKDPAWSSATKIEVDYDLRTRRDDSDGMTVYGMTDGTYLYFAFDVKQNVTITADRVQNDTGVGSDDAVAAYLYPNGPTGFTYAFISNPIGTHNAFSSENTAYAPSWQSYGHILPGGYVVTMKIPLDAIKGGQSDTWRANFRRVISKTLDDYDWSYAGNAIAGNDPPPVDAGTMTGIPVRTSSNRPPPRLQLYGLGEVASPSVGGSTSRMGADISLPVARTASFVSTIHPDYSNVEVDQQTIAPTAFQRYFNEVRPFFTQLQNYYGNWSCYGLCPAPLYTVAIPTPRYGNAIEGTQGLFSFAAFDVAGTRRNDNAQVLNLQTADQRWTAGLERVSASLPELIDDTEMESASYNSQKGLLAGVVSAHESGTLVTNASQSGYSEAFAGLYDKVQDFHISFDRLGSQFSPVDGYVANNGLGGWRAAYDRTWYRAQDSAIPRVIVFAEHDLYHSMFGGLGQSDDQFAVGADLQRFLRLRKLVHVRAQTGSDYLRLPDGTVTPVSQNGIDFTYGYRTGQPLAISYYTGRFGPGRLDYWANSATYLLHRNVSVTVEADQTSQFFDVGGSNTQWLERASLTWQPGHTTSVTLGVRRILGTSPALEQCTRLSTPACLPSPSFIDAYNLSAAFYHRWPHDEIYAAYGDASRLYTVPRFVVKFIHYLGGEKGT